MFINSGCAMPETAVSGELKQHYDGYYKQGESVWRHVCAIDKADNIRRLAADIPHESVLEIGAGEGAILARLAELGFAPRLAALEISASGVEVIQRRSIPQVTDCRLFDGYHVPFADDTFDLAVLSHVIEHVEHPRLLLQEARRVARYVFIEVPIEDTIRLPRDWRPNAVGHINYYSLKSIRYLLQTSGMRVIAQEAVIPSLAVFSFHGARMAWLRRMIKLGLLRACPRLATAVCTYQSALLGRRA